MSQQELELPQGWVLGRISDVVLNPKNDIVDGPFGSNLKSTEYVDQGIPIIRLQNVSRHQFINKNIRYVTKEKAEQLKRHSFLKNDIVMTKLGIPVGKACLVPEFLESGIIVADILRMRVAEKFISKQFILYLINSNFIIKQFAYNTKGTTRPRVNLTKFRNFLIPIPPLNEQKRIVSKIEELFSKIDATKQSLKQTKLQLEQYRQSLLKSAFEGKLTEEWRENNVVEHSSVLLGKIEQDQTKTGRKIKKLVNFDSFKKYELPDNWIWTNILSITKDLGDSPFGSNLKSKDYVDDGIPVIHGRNIKNNEFKWIFPLYVTKKKFDSLKRSHCHPDDIIFQKIGSVGLIAILPKIELHESFLLSTNCMKISTNEKIIPKKFIFYYFIQAKIKGFILRNAQGTSQPIFNFTTLKSFPIPLPSTKEQEQIVLQIEQGFSLIENTTQIVESTLQNLQTIKMSVLKQAFEGKLVPQDPNDEPAEILLQKIKQVKQQLKQKETESRGKKNV